ncbi:DEAD/DEAH box helicase [Arthrobacter pigmenti]
MAFVTMVSTKDKIDGSIKKQVFDFLRKLQENDTAPGLHIEPMEASRDKRVRTGRVNDMWRAVLFKMEGHGETHYVYIGTWPHNKANEIACSRVLTFNSALGVPELIDHGTPEAGPAPSSYTPTEDSPAAAGTESDGDQPSERPVPHRRDAEDAWTHPLTDRWTVEELVSDAGIDADSANAAMAAATPDELTRVVNGCPEVQGLVLLGLVQGDHLATVRRELGLAEEPVAASEEGDDEVLIRGLKTAPVGFAYVGDNPQELREAVESADINQWRVFLHPEQRKYVDLSTNGAYRISGGAGTGKTVVLLHRAKRLADDEPERRILLTTFTRTLADSLHGQLETLDPSLNRVDLGQQGIAVLGIDQVAYRIMDEATIAEKDAAILELFGSGRNAMSKFVPNESQQWKRASASVDHGLTSELIDPSFLQQEYLAVVLANRLTTLTEYVKIPRTGRGTALNRKSRMGLWKIIEAFRQENQLDDQVTFAEQTLLAAVILELRAAAGEAAPEDSVLVDEAQDFHPGHWQLVRALVDKGPDDLFLAEDSHQRIYGQKISLKQFGIEIRGRARRLRLNYRTTAQNLAYAVAILAGEDYQDIEGGGESTAEYHSARTGPAPVEVSAVDLQGELDVAAKHLTDWADQKVPGNHIGIFARSEKAIKSIQSGLSERGREVQVVTARTKRTLPDVPQLMTMHAAKGMEFPKVIVMGVGEGEIPARWDFAKMPPAEQKEALMRERSLLYVAASRARDELVVTWVGAPSELLSVP